MREVRLLEVSWQKLAGVEFMKMSIVDEDVDWDRIADNIFLFSLYCTRAVLSAYTQPVLRLPNKCTRMLLARSLSKKSIPTLQIGW